ncbi:unnamed protein product [Notodromas monacha]|uniref:Aminotransferase class I/classII large domain-containing protein n=1 Tax=Notodromas monacha TaxID=399045 RepID=A0A7R9GDG8_9CRUS|nr:unnamed protein product [Notodromas monacha]CAG0916910.1 unnamed protein product [Notodromas monacha]
MRVSKISSYVRFINDVSQRRQPSAIREITGMLPSLSKDCIVLAGGMPNGDAFPLLSAQFRLRDGSVIDVDEAEMKIGLQYSPTDGYPPLMAKMKEFISRYHLHGSDAEKSDIKLRHIMTPGSQDALSKLLEATIAPGDFIISEKHVYTGVVSAAEPWQPNFLLVDSDGDGMKPEALREALSSWDPSECRKADSGVPKILYTCPSGGNPTGTSLTLARKKEIYGIAQEYNLLIIEDDPYYFLQFSDVLPPSFLSLDTDGRVVRLDSFSKILAAGMRLGCLSGPPEIVERIALHQQVSIMHVPTLLQIVFLKLLDGWGWDGFNRHVESVKELYQTRCNLALDACKKHLSGLAEWYKPGGGMFLWLKVKNVTDTRSLVMVDGVAKGVLCVPGEPFQPAATRKPTPYVRVSYSSASPEMIDEGLRRLAEVIKERHQKNNSVN